MNDTEFPMDVCNIQKFSAVFDFWKFHKPCMAQKHPTPVT